MIRANRLMPTLCHRCQAYQEGIPWSPFTTASCHRLQLTAVSSAMLRITFGSDVPKAQGSRWFRSLIGLHAIRRLSGMRCDVCERCPEDWLISSCAALASPMARPRRGCQV